MSVCVSCAQTENGASKLVFLTWFTSQWTAQLLWKGCTISQFGLSAFPVLKSSVTYSFMVERTTVVKVTPDQVYCTCREPLRPHFINICCCPYIISIHALIGYPSSFCVHHRWCLKLLRRINCMYVICDRNHFSQKLTQVLAIIYDFFWYYTWMLCGVNAKALNIFSQTTKSSKEPCQC